MTKSRVDVASSAKLSSSCHMRNLDTVYRMRADLSGQHRFANFVYFRILTCLAVSDIGFITGSL